MRVYARYVLKEGGSIKKRELLVNLRSKIMTPLRAPDYIHLIFRYLIKYFIQT